MTAPPSLYLPRTDGHFTSTVLTRGPWSLDHQHGGPVSALLAREIERAAGARGSYRLVRILVDLLRPVPIAPVEVHLEAEPTGRRALHATALLRVEGKILARARGLCIRLADLPVPAEAAPPGPTLPPPDEATPVPFPFFAWDEGLHNVVETRFTHGGFGRAHSGAWMRCHVPLVDGEEISPVQHALVAADCGNGISNILPFDRFTFMNPDLHLAFSRPPAPGWIHLDAATEVSDLGSGWSRSRLSDTDGLCGRGTQTLFVDAR